MEKFYRKVGVLLCLLLASQLAFAQFNVNGKVVDGVNNQALPGVNVLLKGTTTGVITNIDGEYNIQVSGSSAVLVFSFVGYLSQELAVNSSTGSLNVSLTEDVTSMEEVVISGLASSIKRSNLANAVGSVSAKELTSMSNQSTMDGALYGKFKGANITSNSGAPGGGLSIRLRGVTSIGGNNEPLYIIDGVYLDNSSISGGLNVVSAASGGGSQSTQDNASNRIADIDPEDIESVEILKGASAAAIYGSRASGGVVIITTKKGKAGKTEVTFSQVVGVTQQLKKLGVRTWDDAKVTAAFGADEVANFQTANSSGTLRNYEDELYGNKGFLSTTRLTASGGTENTRFFAGVTVKDDEGIVKNTGYEKQSFRLNIDQKINSNIDFSLSSNYVHSSSDRGFFNNDNSGTTMGISFVATPSWAQLLPDENGNYPDNPYAASNFLQTSALITNNEEVNRIISSGKLTAKLFTNDQMSLRLIARGGVDNYTLNTTAIFPNTLQFQSNGNGLNGVSVQGNTVNTNTNLAAFLVHDFFPSGSDWSFRTQIGMTAENFDQNNIIGTATSLNGSQTNLDQSANVAVAQRRVEQHDRGFFVQEEVNFSDRIIAAIGLRGDKSSNNGDANELFYYPKASLAVNLHEFDFWSVDFIQQLKLRVAYGEAGNFAPFGSKYNSMLGTNIGSNSGFIISATRGNLEIGPERQKELEFGFDLGVLENKIALDFTYYIKTVEDQLLTAELPQSTGQTAEIINAADMENKGVELGLNLNLVNTADLKWNSRINFWKNTAEVTRLSIPSYTTGGFADFLGQFRIKEGHSPTEVIGVGPNPDEDGLVVFGDAEPDFQTSFLNTVSYKNFEFSMLWHLKQGGKNINLSALLSDLSGTSPDYDDIDLDPEGSLGNGDYRLSVLGSDTGPYIEDAGYFQNERIRLYTIASLKSVIGDALSSW